jgi:hypothetical protein
MQRSTTFQLIVCRSLVVRPMHMLASFHIPQDLRVNRHLLAAVNQTLLCRGNALLLFDALLYPGDLCDFSMFSCRMLSGLVLYREGGRCGRCKEAYLVVGFDVELDLLASEGSYSVVFVSFGIPPLHLLPPERT